MEHKKLQKVGTILISFKKKPALFKMQALSFILTLINHCFSFVNRSIYFNNVGILNAPFICLIFSTVSSI